LKWSKVAFHYQELIAANLEGKFSKHVNYVEIPLYTYMLSNDIQWLTSGSQTPPASTFQSS